MVSFGLGIIEHKSRQSHDSGLQSLWNRRILGQSEPRLVRLVANKSHPGAHPMPSVRIRTRHRPGSNLDRRYARSTPAAASIGDVDDEPDPPPGGPVEYFWRLAEASDLSAVVRLWADFEPRAYELRRLAKSEDLDGVLDRLIRAVEESDLWHQLPNGRRAVLKAIQAAGE
jgi:hypothetical protein